MLWANSPRALKPSGVQCAGVVDGDLSGDVAPATGTANGDPEIVAGRIRVEAQIGGERHAAIAAAAGRALRLDSVGLFLPGVNDTRIDNGNGTAGATVASTAADGYADIPARFTRAEISREPEAAIAAAAADALRQNAGGASARSPDFTGDRRYCDRSCKSANTASATDADADISTFV